MRKTIPLLFVFCILNLFVKAQTPTVPAGTVTFTSIEGNTYRVNWVNGNGARRIVIVRQGSPVTALPVNGVDYNFSNTFGTGDAVQPGQFVVHDGTSAFVDISGLQHSTTYHVAIFEYNGTASTTQYLTSSFPASSQATLTAPTIQASAFVFTNIIGNSMTVAWTNGNGQRRLVIARPGSAVNANPVDLTSYNGVGLFTSGTQIGTGNYAVFTGTGNTVNVSGLLPNTTYHFAVYEYNGSSGPVYLIPGTTGSATTATGPSIAASNMTFNSIEGGSFRVNWTNGNGSRRIVIARAGNPVTAVPVNGVDYNFSNTFGSGDAIAAGEFVVFDGTQNFVDVSNLLPSTVYHFRVFEYDGTGAATSYLTSGFLTGNQSTATTPTVQASGLNFSNLSGSTVTVSWANGNGARRIILGRTGGAVNADPVNLISYNTNTVFGNGSQIGTGNFVVFNSNTGNSVNITNLAINTTYHFAVYEYNGNSGPVYLIPGAVGNITTPAAPTIPPSTMTFNSIEGGSFRANWTSGNGARRIVVARAGSAVTAVPVDGVDYNANVNFGSGDAIAANEFVVFDGTQNFVDLTGLLPATIYHFRVYEYNGTGSNTAYLVSSFATGNQSTLGPPLTQASAINITNVAGSSIQMSWTNGSGVRRIVLARQGSAVNADPVNLTVYNPSTLFGSGTQVGTGNFTVYSTTGNNTPVTNLLPSTTYHFAVYEYNGAGTPVYLVPGATANVTTSAQPTIAANTMTFASVEGNSYRVNWINGNGARRIVIARANNPVTAIPVNGIDYTPATVFGNGDAIQPGQFVVFDGTQTFVDVTALTPNTVYHFAVFEYDGIGTSTTYLTSGFLAGSQSTATTPTLQTSNISFSSVATTSLTIGWTIGNGARRLVVARQGSAVNANPVDLTTYNASAFGLGTQIGTGNFAVASVNTTNAALTGFTSGTTYHFAVYEFNGSGGPVYLTPAATEVVTTLGPPQTQAINVMAGGISTTTMQLLWTNGSGNRRLVLMKQGSAVDADPVNSGVYTANSFFGSGTQLGAGNYVVFDGTANGVLVTGLLPNTIYHFAVFEYNSFGASSQFLLTNPARGNAATSTALPVTFIEFRATNDKDKIELKWSTAQEQNSSHFEIEKSSNGTVFSAIAHTPAAGNSGVRKDYSYTDNSPFEGSNYYRLRQVDINGHFIQSTTLLVIHKPSSFVKQFVNPVKSSLQLELTKNGVGNWKLFDMHGRLLQQKVFSGSMIQENVSYLNPGMYVIEVSMGDNTVVLKFIKQ